MIKDIKLLILKTAKEFNVKPFEVTPAQFWLINDGKIPEWQIRKRGGLNNIKSLLFKNPQVLDKEKQAIYKLIKKVK